MNRTGDDGFGSVAFVRQLGTTSVVFVSGDIDMVTAPQFLDAALFAVHGGPQGLVLDLTEAEFFSAAGLEVLVAARRTATNIPVAVVAANSVTRRPIELTGVDSVVSVYSTLVAALDAVDTAVG